MLRNVCNLSIPDALCAVIIPTQRTECRFAQCNGILDNASNPLNSQLHLTEMFAHFMLATSMAMASFQPGVGSVGLCFWIFLQHTIPVKCQKSNQDFSSRKRFQMSCNSLKNKTKTGRSPDEKIIRMMMMIIY